MAMLLSTYASRPAPRGPISRGRRDGCCQPTVRRPVVELMLVSERTRVGCSTATVCAIMPPIDTPTRCADSRPRWSSSATASPARSDIVYGARELLAERLVPPRHRAAQAHHEEQRLVVGVAEGLVAELDLVADRGAELVGREGRLGAVSG